MDKGKITKYLFLSTGSLLIALSGTLVGKYAFESNVIGVFIGYILFIIAYKTCWYGVHNKGEIRNAKDRFKDFSENSRQFGVEPWKYLMMLLGVYLASHGTTEFAAVVAEPELLTGVEAGISTLGGYILAHKVVNEVPI